MKAKTVQRDYLVIGLGRFGSGLALKLHELGCHVLGVDQDREVVQELSSRLPQVVAVDAISVEALVALGVKEFDTAIVAIGQDFEASVLITNALKHTFGLRHVVAKALTQRQKEVLERVGADLVVLPEHEAGVRLACQLNSSMSLAARMELEAGVSVSAVKCPASFFGKTPKQLDLRNRHHLNLLMIQGKRHVLHPSPDLHFEEGDILILLGADEDVAAIQLLQ